MRLLLGSLFALAVAALVGLGTTWVALTRGTAFGAVAVGAWTAFPKSGTRFWTLTLYDPQGHLIGNAIERQGFTSQEIVRSADGSFDVVVAPRARAGNWLPTNGVDSYLLVLRLYDSPVGVATRAAREAPMPAVVQSCS